MKDRYKETYLVKSSTLKKTYSPDDTILSSSAASSISRTLGGDAQRTTTWSIEI
jgi:hypothetical protein